MLNRILRVHSTHSNFTFSQDTIMPVLRIKIFETNNDIIFSSLVCADMRLNICFSFTRDSSKGFLLRHNFPSYVIYCVKVNDILTVNDREKAVVGVGGGGNPRLIISCIRKGESTFMPSGNTRLLFSIFTTLKAITKPAYNNF